MAKKATTTTTTKAVAKAIDNPDLKKYGKLLGTADYDHEAAEQLALALNEINELNRRAAQLEQVVKENKELHQFVWCTASGENMAIHNIDNEHLENIMLHLIRQNRGISKAIRGEAMRRNLVIPAKVPIDWGGLDKKQLSDNNRSRVPYDGIRHFSDDEEIL